MIGGQKSVIETEVKNIPALTEIEINEKPEQVEMTNEVIFIRRQFQPPSLLEIRFARLRKVMRNRSASIF